MNKKILVALLTTVITQTNAQIASLAELATEKYSRAMPHVLQDLKQGKLHPDIQDIIKKTLIYKHLNRFPLATSKTFFCKTKIESLTFSPDGRDIVIIPTANTFNRVYIANLSDLVAHPTHPKVKVLLHDFPITKALFSPNGEYILTSGPGHFYIWNVADECTVRTASHNHTIQSAALSYDGKYLLTVYSKTVYLSSMTNLQSPPIILDHAALLLDEPHSLTVAACSPDSRYVLTGSSKGKLYLWDMLNLQLPPRLLGDDEYFTELSSFLLGHHSTITEITFSSDNRHVLTQAKDKTAYFWDIAQPEAASRVFYTLDQAVLSQCGNYALTTALGESSLWNLCDHTVAPLVLHSSSGSIHRAIFSPDRRHIVTISFTDTNKSILQFRDLATWDRYTLEDVIKKITTTQ